MKSFSGASVNMSTTGLLISAEEKPTLKGSDTKSAGVFLAKDRLDGMASIVAGNDASLVCSVASKQTSDPKLCAKPSFDLKMLGTRTLMPMSQSAVNASHMKGFLLSESSKQLTAFFLSP
jgi:hypothetical protein